jgi:hypothetical protein
MNEIAISLVIPVYNEKKACLSLSNVALRHVMRLGRQVSAKHDLRYEP